MIQFIIDSAFIFEITAFLSIWGWLYIKQKKAKLN